MEKNNNLKNFNILILKKMSSLEYYYKFKNSKKDLIESHNENNQSIELITNILQKQKITHDIITRESLSEELVSNYSHIISAGGDGTVIALAAYNKDKPQLNIKTDSKSKGALCHKNIEDALNRLIKNDYKIQNWTRQDVYLNNQLVSRALNETCIGEKLRFDQLAKYELEIKNNNEAYNESASSSGLIIATGTGTSAWPSAFKKQNNDSRKLFLKTILKHKGKLKDTELDEIVLNYKGHTGSFSIDTIMYDLPRDSTLKITLSKYPLKVIK